MTLVSTFEVLVQQVSAVMTQPTFQSFLIVLSGWIFARRRTVTGMILAADAVGAKHHCAFHRLIASAQWSLDELGLGIFRLIPPWLDERQVFLALDDTLARKRGLKVHGVGMHHDSRRAGTPHAQNRGDELGAQLGGAGRDRAPALGAGPIFLSADSLSPLHQQADRGEEGGPVSQAFAVGCRDASGALHSL